MLNNLSSQQFTPPTSTNAAGTSVNGQGTSRSQAASTGKSGGTTTVISIKGSTPSISTRA
ncbi:hypothetical protein ACIOHC_35780 [Streptomyces sp. NPDC088252]|uniref:hypothetical protein n=1 Tax=Streptomyces sp. NPDC088252 TaxID=3365845 RepID=UPI00380B1EE9